MKKILGPLAAPLLALTLLLLINLVAWPGFFHITWQDGRFVGTLVDILNRGAPVTILATGMVLVIATGGVDLSVGGVMAIAGSVSAFVLAKAEGKSGNEGQATASAVAGGLAAGAGCGFLNGILVSVIKIQPIIATLILMVAGRGVAQLISDGQIVTFENPSFAAIGAGARFLVPNPIWIAVVVVAIVAALTRLTSLGLFLEAIGANATASRLSGINVKAFKAFAYVVCGILAAIAGMIMTADIKAADANNLGLYYELDAILSVALGGTALSGGKFSLAGAVIGAILMQTLTTTVNSWGIDKSATLILKAILVLSVCILHSDKVKSKFNFNKAKVSRA